MLLHGQLSFAQRGPQPALILRRTAERGGTTFCATRAKMEVRMRISRPEFERLVAEVLEALPADFSRRISKLEIVIEPHPPVPVQDRFPWRASAGALPGDAVDTREYFSTLFNTQQDLAVSKEYRDNLPDPRTAFRASENHSSARDWTSLWIEGRGPSQGGILTIYAHPPVAGRPLPGWFEI